MKISSDGEERQLVILGDGRVVPGRGESGWNARCGDVSNAELAAVTAAGFFPEHHMLTLPVPTLTFTVLGAHTIQRML